MCRCENRSIYRSTWKPCVGSTVLFSACVAVSQCHCQRGMLLEFCVSVEHSLWILCTLHWYLDTEEVCFLSAEPFSWCSVGLQRSQGRRRISGCVGHRDRTPRSILLLLWFAVVVIRTSYINWPQLESKCDNVLKSGFRSTSTVVVFEVFGYAS